MKAIPKEERQNLLDETVKTLGVSREQAQKRLDALEKAIESGMFESVPDDPLGHMFMQFKIDQIMTTQVD